MGNAVALSHRVYELPWSTGAEQERRFRRQLMIYVVSALVAAVVLSFLPVPERDRSEFVEIPERFARLLLEELPPPPPPVVRQEPEPEPVVEESVPLAEPVVEAVVEAVDPAPVVVPEPAPEPVAPPEPSPAENVREARERASVAGLLPFARELQSLRDVEIAESIVTHGQGAPAETAAAVAPERALIASNVGSSSGGISTAELSRNTGGSGIGTRQTTQVESPVEALAPAGGAATRVGESNLASRSREEIERVFDQNKGAIYALYNRALRANPTLQGKVVLRLTITPAGQVSACEIVSSELNDSALEQRLVQRILLFEFEARDVETVTTTKPIDFFPA